MTARLPRFPTAISLHSSRERQAPGLSRLVVTGAGDRGSFDVDVHILRQAQYFGHGGGLRHALILWQVH